MKYKNIPFLILFSLLISIAPSYSRAASPKPNILVILSDNQSYYEMGCHGHAQIKTPNIDKLASQSVDFQNFHSPPFCSPSRSVIMTGHYALRSGVHDTLAGRSILHKNETTIANILKNQGYRTGIFGKWHLGSTYPHRPQDRGFEETFIFNGDRIGELKDHLGNTVFNTTFQNNGRMTRTQGYCTDTVFKRAQNWIYRSRNEPFFCFVSAPVTQSPHYGPPKLVKQLKDAGVEGDIELFAQVQNLDKNIGMLLRSLNQAELSDNTIVIYASDQGMSDRGSPKGPNKQGISYDSSHHIPFMIRMNGMKPTVSTDLTGMIDLFPTILDLCNIPVPKSADGISLKPVLAGNSERFKQNRSLIIQCPKNRKAEKWKNSSVKMKQWRLVDGTQLYNILLDPLQKTDIATDHPTIIKQLRKKYESYWSSLPKQETTLSRHQIGSAKSPETILNATDWYTGSKPSQATDLRREINGAWAITVVEDGTYTFECQRYPRESPRTGNINRAKIQIGEVTQEQYVEPTAKSVLFELDLKAGEYDMQTWLTKGNRSHGALFVYVNKK